LVESLFLVPGSASVSSSAGPVIDLPFTEVMTCIPALSVAAKLHSYVRDDMIGFIQGD
jgi:hypothetical protein